MIPYHMRQNRVVYVVTKGMSDWKMKHLGTTRMPKSFTYLKYTKPYQNSTFFSKNPAKIWLLPNEKPPVLMTVSALAHNGNRMVWDWSGQGNKMVWVCSGQYQYALNITSMLLIVPVLPIAYWYLTEHTGPKYKLGEYKIMTWP